MESGTSEKSIKSDILRVENLYWAVITALVLALVYIFRDTFGVAGLIVGLLALIAIYLGYRNYKLKGDIKELCSDTVSKSEVRNIYLKQLLDPNTLCGYVVILEEDIFNPMVHSIDFKKGENIEITAFANQRFNFALISKQDFEKLDIELLFANGISLIHFLREHYEIKTEVSYNHSPSLKTRYIVPDDGEYKIIFCRSNHSNKGRTEINFLISTVPKQAN